LTKRDEQGRVIAQSGPFQGAVFQGVNFHDNLGTAMLTADDYDGDGRPEIIFAAQYAKPFYFTQTGRGSGEAYMIYGQASRFSGSIGANSIGVSIPGVVFTGIVPNRYQGDLPLPDSGFGNPAMAGNS